LPKILQAQARRSNMAAHREYMYKTPEVFYNGPNQDPMQWEEDFEISATVNCWNTDERNLSMVPAFLSGPPLEWFLQHYSAQMWITPASGNNNPARANWKGTNVNVRYFINDFRTRFITNERLN